MKHSLIQFAKRHNVKMKLSHCVLKSLESSRCDFCNTNTKQKTYQNVGLHKWKHGFIDNNVFPLCKKCYKIRNGQSLNKLLKTIICIMFRIPVNQKMKFKNSQECRTKNMCKADKCAYCYNKRNLSFNKINPFGSYDPQKIQTLCWTCNRMKSNLKENVFFSHLRKLCLKNYSSLKSSMSK
jgi:hypothetical protein